MAQITDFKGNVYKTITEMCKAYNISLATFSSRIRSGLTLEEALTKKVKSSNCKAVTDFKGDSYDSIKEMCEAHGIKYQTYVTRKKNGYTDEEALSFKTNRGPCKIITDAKGRKFRSIKDMCETNKVPYATYMTRIEQGLTKEEALSKRLRRNGGKANSKEVEDHLGNKYSSIQKMCEAYGVSYATYLSRLNKGATLEAALIGGFDRAHNKEVEDHLGNKYNSIKDMCEAYDVSYLTFRSRIRRGVPLEKALLNGRIGRRNKDNTNI